MTILNLAKGKSPMRYPLRLPASANEFQNAYSQINSMSSKGDVHIDSVTSPVWNLGEYIRREDISDPEVREKLNTLAKKIERMDEVEQRKLACVFDARSIMCLDDLLTAADSLGDYVYYPEITNERELGLFLVENRIMQFPENTWPYLDYRAIGIEYHVEHSGALTPNGYVVRRSEESQEAQREKPVFRALLWTEAMWHAGVEQPYPLELPASAQKLEQARKALGNEPFETVGIVQAECLDPLLRGKLTMEDPDVEVMQELGSRIRELEKSERQIQKFLAVLEVEQPDAMVDALELSEHLDGYSLLPDDAEAYGQEALKMNFPAVDDDLIDELDGFTDWDAYGNYMMEADDVRITEYGLLRREDEPFPDETMGPRMEMG